MRHLREHDAAHVSRRSLFLATAGTLAVGVAGPVAAHVRGESDSTRSKLLPAPKPIPGGLVIPPLIHGFVPGPETITLPFSHLTLQGLNVEPSTITDFQGVTALAYIIGTATGSDGVRYGLEADMRGYEGQYLGEDGELREGAFAFM
jgi:hypothetical protein